MYQYGCTSHSRDILLSDIHRAKFISSLTVFSLPPVQYKHWEDDSLPVGKSLLPSSRRCCITSAFLVQLTCRYPEACGDASTTLRTLNTGDAGELFILFIFFFFYCVSFKQSLPPSSTVILKTKGQRRTIYCCLLFASTSILFMDDFFSFLFLSDD